MIALGGHIECRRNWQTYIEEFASAIAQLSGATMQAECFAADLAAPLIPFEEK